jgi:hypothetical protein
MHLLSLPAMSAFSLAAERGGQQARPLDEDWREKAAIRHLSVSRRKLNHVGLT